jgi:GTP-binding protein LepA
MQLCEGRRGDMQAMDYLTEERVELRYVAAAGRDHHRLLRPAEVDDARVRLAGLRASASTGADLVKVDVLLNGDPVDAFSSIVHRDKAYEYGKPWSSGSRS